MPTAGERTILFTDVEGSTQLRGRFGDRAADEILGLHERIVRGHIQEHGGEEVAFLGDGFMASFPSPEDGVRCAVGIQRTLEEHSRTHPDRPVRIRIGLHHGAVAEREGTLYGQAVHAAARVMSEAAGAQIFVSPAVREGCGTTPDLAFVDRGLFWLKGFPDRWRLHEVEWWDEGALSPVPSSVPADAPPFVEREAERADLRRAVHAALGGEGSLVLVGGEAGVGKTRLIQEVDAEAAARGMRVLIGHCVEMDGAPPYLPWVEILEEALIGSRSPLALREALGEEAPEIARIVPGLRRVIADLPPPLDLPPEQARRYVWVSLQEFLERAAQDRPLLLVLEDLHWADESTLLLLEHLAPDLGRMPVLIVGTYRDVEVGAAHPLARTMNQLLRARLLTRIDLKRLSRDGVIAMVRGLAGQEPPDGLVRAIHSETEGNPFFVEEVYLHLAESGRLLDDRGRFRSNLRIDEIDVPASVRLVVGGRLERLSEATRDVLVGAAVIGRVFSLEVVQRVTDLGPDAITEALDEAERARLVGLAETDRSRLAFTHELIRQTLLADSSSVRRQRLHARAAEAVEHTYAGDLEAHAADLAHHLSRSGPGADTERLVRYLRMAGDRAMDVAAFEDALAHFEHALTLVRADDRDRRAELLERQAMALRSVARWDDALRAMDGALELYEALGRTDALGRLCWAMVYQLAWAARFEEAVLVAGRGLGALGDLPNPDRARLLCAGGWIFGLGGAYDTATEMFEQGLELAEELNDDRALADGLHLKTIHHMGYAQFPQGIDTGLRAAEVFEDEGALWDLCSVLSFVEFEAGTMDRLEQAGTLRKRVDPLADRLGHVGAKMLVLIDTVRADGVRRGDLETLEADARELLAVCERADLPWIYTAHLYLGLAAHWRGDWEDAERELRTATELEPPAAFAGQTAGLLAIHLAHAGNHEEVLRMFEERRDLLPVAGRVNTLGAWNTLFGFTEALYLSGHLKEAASLAPMLDEALGLGVEWVTFECRGIRTRAAIAAAAGRRWREAEEHYVGALAEAEALPSEIEVADVRRLHAQMLLDRAGPGDRERAARLLGEAAVAYSRMGMPRLESLAVAMRDGDGVA